MDECEICGIEVNTDEDGASIINGFPVHNDCVIGNTQNLLWVLKRKR